MKNLLRKLFESKKRRIIVIGALVLILAIILRGIIFGNNEEEVIEQAPRSVEVSSIFNIVNNSTPIPTVGRVEAQNEAVIRTEATGEISYVRKSLGNSVYAGEVIAEIKNPSERASVLRAQGVLQSAEASLNKLKGSTGDSSVLIGNAIKSAYITSDDAVKNKVDLFVIDGDLRFPRILPEFDDYITSDEFQDGRYNTGNVLEKWAISVDEIDQNIEDAELILKYNEAVANLQTVQSFLNLVSDEINPILTGSDLLPTYKANVSLARTNVNNSLNSLIATYSTYSAQIEGVGGGEDIQVAEANVTQARAGLLSAQAELGKTIIKSPITGKLNALTIKQGDFVSSQEEVAEVVGSGELEIVAYISEDDRADIEVGSKVYVDGVNVGTVSIIAPGINFQNQKVEIRIKVLSLGDLKNGQSVSLKIDRKVDDGQNVNKDISIPLSALKITSTGSLVYTLDSENKLVAKSVVSGPIVGDRILILEGLTLEDEIVLDLRGLKEGQVVTVN